MSLRDFVYNKDFVIVVGDNGSGKTTVVRYLVEGVPKDKVYVLNASGQKWDFAKKNVQNPLMYSNEFFNKYCVNFLAKHSNCTLILDDADNFNIKHNDYLKSLVINARHASIGVILSVRQVQDIDKIIYKQAKSYISYQSVDYDTVYLSKMMPRTIAEYTKTLNEYEFLNFCYEGVKPVYRKFKVPEQFASKWHNYTKGE